ARAEERLPRRDREGGPREQLEPVLPRVPRARDEDAPRGREDVRGPPPLRFRWSPAREGEGDRGGPERPDRCEVGGGEPLQGLRRPRPLEREAQELPGEVTEGRAVEVVPDPRDDSGAGARVAHAQVPLRREAGEDHVVED